MFSLIGLYDCYENTGIELASQLYDEGIETLKYVLPYYDSHDISYYHLGHLNATGMPVFISTSYHLVHVKQLHFFYQIEKDEIFAYYMNKWNQYVIEAL